MATASYLTDKIKLDGVAYNLPRLTATGVAATQPPYTVGSVVDGYGAYATVDDRTLYPTLSPSANDNPLWIIYNGSLVNEWATISTQHDGQEHLICTLENGNYIKASNNNGSDEFKIYYYNSQDQLVWSGTRPTRSYMKFCALTVTKNDENDTLYMQFLACAYNPENVYNSSFYWTILPAMNVAANSTFANNSIVPAYTWTAWDQIAGNGGQYRCNLTKIKDDSITVDTTTTDGTESDFDRIGSQSSIWAIFQNMPVGTEKIVAWSGENWLTLTLVDNGIPDTYSFVFKFYTPAISSTTPFYTLSRVITYGGSVPTRDLWLSFAYDNEQQAAVFLPVTYDTGTLQPGYEWGGVSASADEMLYLYLWLQASGAGTPEYPYDTGTTDNGGNPGGPQPGDHMPTPGVPTLSGMSSGMFTVYNPTNTQLEQIGEFLWSANVIDNIRKYFNDFADNIIALYVLPCKLSNLPTKSFKVGNMQSDTITGVEYLTQRFTAVDMGSVYIKNVFDSYLDYSPFTKFELYLPGIGMQTLSADDISAPTDPETGTLKAVDGSTISLTYNIDLMTGLVVAMIKINGELRYQFPGKVGYSIPLTGANYTQMVTGFITAAAGLVGAAATGGLSAPLSAAGVGAAVSGTVNAMKPEIHRGGNLSGDVSSLSERTPYIICHRPNKPLLENQERYTGFPSYKSGALSEFSGLTQVIDAHIEGISCTEAERAEILNLLKGGVIL